MLNLYIVSLNLLDIFYHFYLETSSQTDQLTSNDNFKINLPADVERPVCRSDDVGPLSEGINHSTLDKRNPLKLGTVRE